MRISALVSEQSHSSQDRFVNLIFHPVFLALLSLSLSVSIYFFISYIEREREGESLPHPRFWVHLRVPLSFQWGAFSGSLHRESISVPPSLVSLAPSPATSSPLLPLPLLLLAPRLLALSRTRSPDDSQTAGLYGVDLLNRLASGYTENKNALSNA